MLMVDVKPILERYPVKVELENNMQFTIRPLEQKDKIPLAQFFVQIPEEDRFYLKENVTAPEVIHGWIDNLDLERVIPLVAFLDGRVVADATLHRSRAQARRHIGELRVVVHPDFRGIGLGSRLIQELIDLSNALKLEKVFFELVDRRESGAIRAAVQAGFEEVAVLKGRVRDIYGSLQDLIIMELQLEDETEFGHF